MQIPDAEKELALQLSELKYIEKGFDYIGREKYEEALYCFEEAEFLLDPIGYFSDSKHKLIVIGQSIICSLLDDLDLLDSIQLRIDQKDPMIKDPLFLNRKRISKYIALRLDDEISDILKAMENDYQNQNIFFFDFGLGRFRQWMMSTLKPTIIEFYRD
jgi:tetratricopeptide (TPR) repeat protein